jgi:hypothetical protein
MHFAVDLVEPHRVTVRLRDGGTETKVSGWRPDVAIHDLLRALDGAAQDGYADCYWPEPTGQYWWMLRCDDRRLEIAVMWSAGAVPGWQHVFRAVDEVGYVLELVRDAFREAGLITP